MDRVDTAGGQREGTDGRVASNSTPILTLSSLSLCCVGVATARGERGLCHARAMARRRWRQRRGWRLLAIGT